MILLVEDDDIVARLLDALLRKEKIGRGVCRVCTGEDAIRRLGEDPNVSLVLLDVRLGGPIDGNEVLQYVWNMEDRPRVIFLTAYPQDIRDELKGVADSTVEKPFDREFLMGEVRKHYHPRNHVNGGTPA